MLPMPKLTPTEERLAKVLEDGEPHTKAELLEAIGPTADDSNLYSQVTLLRLKLKVVGEDVLPVSRGRGVLYRRVRHLKAMI